MYLLVTPFTLLEVLLFIIALTAFVLAIRFFITSQRNLRQLMPEKPRKGFGFHVDRDGFILPTGARQAAAPTPKPIKVADETRQEMNELREMMRQQQTDLSKALRQIEALHEPKEDTGWDDYSKEESPTPEADETAQKTIAELERQLQRRDYEVEELEKEGALNHRLQTHFEEVQLSYDLLQAKVEKMEGQAWQAAELAMKVDSLEQANEQLEKTLLKREEKVRELSLENGRLHEQLAETEDKLTQANLQRQQLFKKTKFLEEINNDIQQMSDANRKLKTELRRVAELESMLNLITEERDVLLKRRAELG